MDNDDGAAPVVDWTRAFDAAGLDIRTFSPVAPQWVPRDYADARAAWQGLLPDSGVTVRVEASAFHGRTTYFQVIGPWTQPNSQSPRPIGGGRGDRIVLAIAGAAVASVLMIAVLLAARNLRSGRADLRGATRLALFLAAVRLTRWLLTAHHTSSPGDEMESFGGAVSAAALSVAILWVNYVALEPYIRRIWPDTLLGWSRILAGHIRDSRVGHDVLIGILSGAAVTLLQVARTMILPALGFAAPSAPYGDSLEMLIGPGEILGGWLAQVSNAVGAATGFVLAAVLLRLVLRIGWLAFAVTSVVFATLMANEIGTGNTALIFLFPIVGGALLTTVLTRYGLLTLFVSLFVFRVLTAVPFVPDPSHWTAAPGNWTVFGLALLTTLAFYAARGGQPVFGRVLPD